MKKLITFLVTSMIASGAFATIELNANNYVLPLCVSTVDFDNGTKDLYSVLPVGFEVKSTFYFGDIAPVNFGLNVGLSGDYFKYNRSDNLREIEGGFNATAVFGPAVSFNFGRTSLFVSPGLQATVMGVKHYDDDNNHDVHTFDIASDYGFHIEAGYRIWILQASKFDLGINFGADYSIGLGRFGTYTVDETQNKKISDNLFDIKTAQRVKAYVGVCFHFDK